MQFTPLSIIRFKNYGPRVPSNFPKGTFMNVVTFEYDGREIIYYDAEVKRAEADYHLDFHFDLLEASKSTEPVYFTGLTMNDTGKWINASANYKRI